MAMDSSDWWSRIGDKSICLATLPSRGRTIPILRRLVQSQCCVFAADRGQQSSFSKGPTELLRSTHASRRVDTQSCQNDLEGLMPACLIPSSKCLGILQRITMWE